MKYILYIKDTGNIMSSSDEAPIINGDQVQFAGGTMGGIAWESIYCATTDDSLDDIINVADITLTSDKSLEQLKAEDTSAYDWQSDPKFMVMLNALLLQINAQLSTPITMDAIQAESDNQIQLAVQQKIDVINKKNPINPIIKG